MHALVLAPLIALAPPPAAVHCPLPQTTPTAQHAPARAQKLGELPDAEMDLAVLRSIDGCAVRQVVRFNVSSRNPLSRPEPGLHLPGYPGTLVPDGPVTRKTQPVR